MTDKLTVFCTGFSLAAFLEELAQRHWPWVFFLAVALALAALSMLMPEAKEAA